MKGCDSRKRASGFRSLVESTLLGFRVKPRLPLRSCKGAHSSPAWATGAGNAWRKSEALRGTQCTGGLGQEVHGVGGTQCTGGLGQEVHGARARLLEALNALEVSAKRQELRDQELIARLRQEQSSLTSKVFDLRGSRKVVNGFGVQKTLAQESF